MKSGIKASLKDVGKGWFNLQETRVELYEVSKLKKFMDVVKFMMRDSMKYLVTESANNFASFIEVSASTKATVKGVAEIATERTLDRKKFKLVDYNKEHDKFIIEWIDLQETELIPRYLSFFFILF